MHKAKAVILTCMDFRFQKMIQKWLQENNYLGTTDEIIVAGATRDIVKPLNNSHKEYLLRQLELSVKLHDPDEIILLDHQDCGGYAQDQTIPLGLDYETDKESHKATSKIAKDIISSLYPNKTIRTLYINFDGKVEEL